MGATIPGTVANVLVIPNNTPAYLQNRLTCFLSDDVKVITTIMLI
jgi:hypothetical protein